MPKQPLRSIPEAKLSGMADPTLRALYEELAAKEGTYPYAMARSDYLTGNDLLSKK
jgi:hypothetical protein